MKKLLLLGWLSLATTIHLVAQCTGGKIECSLNWDYLEFFPSGGLGAYTGLAHSQTQRFTFGTQAVTITHNFTGSNARGENSTNTVTAGYGSGDDVNFRGNGTITFTFDAPVDNIRFSLYDIDRNQRVTINSPGANVNLSTFSGTILSIGGNNSATANAKAASTTSVANNDDNGALNVSITRATSISTFTITITETGTTTGETGDVWLSDVYACSAGTFSTDFFEASKPFNNQGAYVLISKDNQVYYADVNTGNAKLLFTAPLGANDINAMAYDPVNHYVYYVQDNATPLASNRTLYRYHYDMDTLGPVISDISTLIPTFDVGVESGGAAFYDGSLYFGVDISNSGSYECVIWRIDFDASHNPLQASQVFAIDANNHDWGDFAVTKGTLFNFDGQAGAENYHHQDLYTKAVTTYGATGTNIPKQTGVDWNGNVYSVGDLTSSSPFRGVIIPYNESGVLVTASSAIVQVNGAQITGQWRDGAEAFKPKADFGDAPTSYDPASGDPAVHEISSQLYLGDNINDEWTSRGRTVAANADNFDDGMIMGSIVNPSAGTFFTQVKYFNNTGVPATICAWVDFNNNGVFDAGEGQIRTNLPSSATAQSVFFNWSGITTTLVDGQYTYVRIRIAPMAAGMTVSNATGFFGDGEVEDYRVVVTNFPLESKLISFGVTRKSSDQAFITWKVANEQADIAYVLQRSPESRNWTDIHETHSSADNAIKHYEFIDPTILKKTTYYRLKIISQGHTYFSDVHILNVSGITDLTIIPNPASSKAVLTFDSKAAENGHISIYDAMGRKVQAYTVKVLRGHNLFSIDASGLQNGLYWIRLETSDTFVHRLLIQK